MGEPFDAQRKRFDGNAKRSISARRTMTVIFISEFMQINGAENARPPVRSSAFDVRLSV